MSAKGSTWEDHKYVKRIDGTYYYPSGYDKGRTVDSLKNDESENKENANLSSEDIDNLALEVIRGNFGNGQIRKDLLRENYQAIQDKVNELMKVINAKQINLTGKPPEFIENGKAFMNSAAKKVTKTKVTTASKRIDMEQVQSVYRKKRT